jgi:hypothetical protein
MRRTVPLLITALVGLILIASRFIPAAESWGEVATIWFDVMAAVAFVLGGGSLVKLLLKKISDRAAGWGYSAITLISFAIMLFVGLSKIGSHPADQQEFYGQSFEHLDVADLPESTIERVAGTFPKRADGEELPLSSKRQLREESGQLVFRGWMTTRQRNELTEFKDSLAWQCAVQKLFDATQPKPLKGQIEYLADYSALSARGSMSDEVREALLQLKGNERWNRAVEALYEQGQRISRVSVPNLPPSYQIPASLRGSIFYDDKSYALGIRGPMSTAERDTLARVNFPQVHPMRPEARAKFRRDLESHGSPLSDEQAASLESVLEKTWSVDKLHVALDAAGKTVAIEKSPCELAQIAAASNPQAAVSDGLSKSGPDQVLNQKQQAELDRFAAEPAMTLANLEKNLRAAGPFNDRQADALKNFFEKIPTVGEQKLELCVKLLRDGPLSRGQYEFLVHDYREQNRWRHIVGALFVKAHVTKYPWSGQYNTQDSAFGWMFEFVFKPLQATMFALLAFYVASAAFRAFRAKNLEAILLLGTAFIILLGQTFAGYWLTSWIPDNSWLATLKIKNLIEWVAVFLTAGGRAIMIGIALGIASTSLKVLLGIDRSHIGTGGG